MKIKDPAFITYYFINIVMSRRLFKYSYKRKTKLCKNYKTFIFKLTSKF